jgi:hypothetical protein
MARSFYFYLVRHLLTNVNITDCPVLVIVEPLAGTIMMILLNISGDFTFNFWIFNSVVSLAVYIDLPVGHDWYYMDVSFFGNSCRYWQHLHYLNCQLHMCHAYREFEIGDCTWIRGGFEIWFSSTSTASETSFILAMTFCIVGLLHISQKSSDFDFQHKWDILFLPPEL